MRTPISAMPARTFVAAAVWPAAACAPPVGSPEGGAPPRLGVAAADAEASDSSRMLPPSTDAEPHESELWEGANADLVLRRDNGTVVIDSAWNEMLLDVSTVAKRARLATIVGAWIARCAVDGFDAIEIDNLDTYTRAGRRLQADHAVAFLRLLADRAHAEGLAIAQKNTSELVGRRDDMATDFAIAEECDCWQECGEYTRAYGGRVFAIEYPSAECDDGSYSASRFANSCDDYPSLSRVLRDVAVRPAGTAGYVYATCP